MTIKSLLIANRGEIAVRIIRTCRHLGIRAIAVYSEADRYAPHVALADEGVLIGPAESAQSYLDARAIIAAAQKTGAEAIHPGYGFLSESEALIAACEDANIIFVGPHRRAIRLMGSKIASKAIAESVDVPVIPGYHEDDQSAAALSTAAARIGFPLMIKASAGGGGRGMRRIDSLKQFTAELPQAQHEALLGFADDKILLEKLICEPRHIEVQIAADKAGNTIHLFERECSIQRNHQKIIEEAPAAHLTDEQRLLLYRSATALAQAIDYDSLGTVEFLLDNTNGNIYFLEMNTRLQVEHPVTEAVTGLDLVAWQIAIAAGAPLPLSQNEVALSGWAIEARVNAEDPAENYLPQTGVITEYREPNTAGVRIDSGVHATSQVTPYYDPMLAKVIGTGDNREQARLALLRGLAGLVLRGVGNNLDFLQGIVSHDNFSQQVLSTNFLPNSFPDGWRAARVDDRLLTSAAIACVMPKKLPAAGNHISPWQSLGAFRLLGRAGLPGQRRVILTDPDTGTRVITVRGEDGNYQAKAEGQEGWQAIHAAWLTDSLIQLEMDGCSHVLEASIDDTSITLVDGSKTHAFGRLDEQQLALRSRQTAGNGECQVTATLPGQVVEIKVQVGDSVGTGDTLVVLDSMKLLHNLNAQIDGTVKEIFCAVSDSVDSGAVLIELEPAT